MLLQCYHSPTGFFFHDATYTDTYAETNICNSAVSIGHASVRETEEQKRRKYVVLRACFRFESVASVETASVYEESIAALISEIGSFTEATGENGKVF